MKEQLAAGLSERQVAELVENNELHAREIFGEPPLPAGAGLALQPVDEIDDGEEATPGAAADAGPRKAELTTCTKTQPNLRIASRGLRRYSRVAFATSDSQHGP